ncbi:hypothetical protein LA080_002888 [Diaporthe eres]|nr:hypothetical protein LA080_002888 [Diaporthe eres]
MSGNMANQATSSQVPSAAKATTTSIAPAHTSNAGRKRRSCLMCSTRKVKCDKQKPCIYCVKAGVGCVFPATASNRTEVGGTPELVEMLQRLEKAVQTLGPRNAQKAESTLRTGHEPSSQVDRQIDPRQRLDGKAPSVSSSHAESPGKIIRDHGRDTYVRRWFWDDESNGIESGSLSDTDSDDVRQDQGPVHNASMSQYPGIIGSSREKVMQMVAAQKTVMDADPPDSANGTRCVRLAVYYGAVTSFSEEECVIKFGNGQAQVLSRMREELEGLFAKALLLHTGDIRPLQALTLYLVFLRHHEPQLSWKLSGLAIRLAQNFGLQGEDSFRGLTKFEMEMRRRLWWQLATMDAPSAEDYSGEYNLLEMSSFDTRPPQNLDDEQLKPAMAEYPPEAKGITEMTFTLASCQIATMYRCIADSRRTCGNTSKGYGGLTPQERADWIEACESNFSERYLKDCSPTNPFH